MQPTLEFTQANSGLTESIKGQLETMGILHDSPAELGQYRLFTSRLTDGVSLGILLCLARIDIPDSTGSGYSLKSFNVLVDEKRGGVLKDISNVDAFVLE